MTGGGRHLAGLGLALLAASSAAEPVKYELDPTHTFPAFEISHLGFSRHRGRFNDTRGSVILDRIARRGEIDVQIAAASIDTGHEALEKVLRGEGFFDAEKFPELRFRANRIDFEGERPIAAHGTLSIKNVERPLSLQIDHFHCGRRVFEPRPVCGANATTRLRRSEFGIDKFVNFGLGDEVKIEIQIEALAEVVEPATN